jgi:hypothetical protein
MSDATIAAVIPLHNKAGFVARAVASVFGQTRPVDEIIIVDDASTDNGLGKIAAFLRDPRVKVLRRDRPGAGGYAARNLAIRSATSEWIAFLDADDCWKSHFVETISKLIAQAPTTTGCVFTGHEKVWFNNVVVRDKYSLRHKREAVRSLDFESFVSEWLKIGRSPIWTSACAIRRDILIGIGLFPEGRCRLGGDKDTWLRTMAETNALSSPSVGARYQSITENQVTRQETFNCQPCLVSSVEQLVSKAKGRQKRLLRKLANLEMFDQGVVASASEAVRRDVYHRFHIALNPCRYVLLLGLAHLPRLPRKLLRACILSSRSVFVRLTEPKRVLRAHPD